MKNSIKVKTMLSIAGIIVLAAVIGFSMTACKDEDGDKDDNPFIGTWVGTWGDDPPGDLTVVATATAFSATVWSDTHSGTYTYSGNTITYYEGAEAVGQGTLSGNTITGTTYNAGSFIHAGFTVSKVF